MTYRAAQVKNGLSTTRPPATGSGMMYTCNDIPALYIDDPSTQSWLQYATQYMPKPPLASAYTAAGSVAAYQIGDTVRMINTLDNTPGCMLATGSLPQSSPWVVTLCATPIFTLSATFPDIAVVVANGVTSGSSQAWGVAMYSSAGPGAHGFNSVIGTATRNSLYYENGTSAVLVGGTGRLNFRLLNDGTGMYFQYSSDGFHYHPAYCLATPSGLTNYGVWLGLEGQATGSSWMQALVYENNLTTLTIGQQTVTACTGNAVPVKVTIASTTGFQVGDRVSVHGMVGNTAANSSTNSGTVTSFSVIITTINSSTQMTLNVTGNGTWSSGGVITLLSR